MGIVAVYVATLVAFLAIDAVALKFMMYPLFSRHVGDLLREQMQLGVAAGFYLFYVAGVLYFAVMPGLKAESLGLAALNGAILGFLAYGTYEATNMATLRGWSWAMVATDVTWGTVLTMLTAVIGYLVARALV
jgi:uncharacterized membrane protein